MNLKEKLNKLCPMKFHVRVRYWGKDRFVVEYAYYRFIPNWTSLVWWFDQGIKADTYSWSTQLYRSAEAAENVAQQLNSIEDVREYHRRDEEKAADFMKRREEYYNQVSSYGTKNIK